MYNDFLDVLKRIDMELNSNINFSKISEGLNESLDVFNDKQELEFDSISERKRTKSLQISKKADLKSFMKSSFNVSESDKEDCSSTSNPDNFKLIDDYQTDLNKEEIVVMLDDLKLQIKQNKTLYHVSEQESFYFVASSKMFRLVTRLFFSLVNNLKFIIAIGKEFKPFFQAFLIAAFIQLMFKFDYYLMTIGFLIQAVIYNILSKSFNFNLYVIKYCKFRTSMIKNGSLDIEKIRFIVHKSHDSIFKSFNQKDKLVELQKHLTYDNMKVFEIYLLRLRKGNLISFIKIKAYPDRLILKFYGKFNYDVYKHLELVMLKFRFKDLMEAKIVEKVDQKDKKNEEETEQDEVYQKRRKESRADRGRLLKSIKSKDVVINDINEIDEIKTLTPEDQIAVYSSDAYLDALGDHVVNKYNKLNEKESLWKTIQSNDEFTMKSVTDKRFIIRKTEVVINCNIQKIIDILTNSSKATLYNPLISKVSTEKNFRNRAALAHIVIKTPFPLTNRDSAVIGLTKDISDNNKLLITTSCPEIMFPTMSKYVRSKLKRLYGYGNLGSVKDRQRLYKCHFLKQIGS